MSAMSEWVLTQFFVKDSENLQLKAELMARDEAGQKQKSESGKPKTHLQQADALAEILSPVGMLEPDQRERQCNCIAGAISEDVKVAIRLIAKAVGAK